MTFYFTVNHVPACTANETLDPRLDPPTKCAHETRAEAEASAARVRALYPGAEVKVHEGRCPTPRDPYDAGYQAGLGAVECSVVYTVTYPSAKDALLRAQGYREARHYFPTHEEAKAWADHTFCEGVGYVINKVQYTCTPVSEHASLGTYGSYQGGFE